MPPPTTAVLFSATVPAPPPGLQNTVPQSDGAQPAQKVSEYMPAATAALAGAVRPDGTTLAVDVNGVMSVIATGTGPGGGGTSASGGLYVCVSPTQDPADGTRTQFILPAPQLAGTIGWLNRNDAMQRQLGPKAYYSLQGTQLTLLSPLESDGYLEYYYIQGTPDSESGGGGGVTPTGPGTGGSGTTVGFSYGATSATVPWPTGTQAGDLIILLFAISDGDMGATPSGWTLGGHHAYGSGIGAGWILSKTLSSGDIATGSVVVNFANPTGGAYSVVNVGGGTGGIREVDASVGAGAATATVTTSSAVISSDQAIYFGANGANSFSGGYGPTINYGTLQSVANPGNISGFVGAALYTASPSPAGATGIQFTYNIPPSSFGPGTYQAVVIVMA